MIEFISRFFSVIFGSSLFRYIAYPCIAVSIAVGISNLLWSIIDKRC